MSFTLSEKPVIFYNETVRLLYNVASKYNCMLLRLNDINDEKSISLELGIDDTFGFFKIDAFDDSTNKNVLLFDVRYTSDCKVQISCFIHRSLVFNVDYKLSIMIDHETEEMKNQSYIILNNLLSTFFSFKKFLTEVKAIFIFLKFTGKNFSMGPAISSISKSTKILPYRIKLKPYCGKGHNLHA